MQQDNCTRAYLLFHPAPNLFRSRPRRVEHPERPPEHRVMKLARNRTQKWAAITVRRTKGAWGLARCPLAAAMRHFELMPNPPAAGEVQLHVVMGMISRHVAFAHHAPRDRW